MWMNSEKSHMSMPKCTLRLLSGGKNSDICILHDEYVKVS